MLFWLVASSVRFRLLVIPVVAVLTVVGASQLHKAPIDVLPEINPTSVEVQTESLGLSTAEVEQLITIPMEHFLLNGIKGVETIRSDSAPGVSRIQLIFQRGTKVLDARGLVQEQLTRIAVLPNVSAPPQMLQPVSSTSRVMMIGLTSTRLSPINLSILARWTIAPRLLGLVGVANVSIWGQRDRQLQVLVDPPKLLAKHLTLAQIIRTAGNAQLVSPLTFLNASTPGTGGFIDGPNQRLSIRHQLPLGQPSNLKELPVDGTKGVSLGSVAQVVEGHQPLIGDAVVHGGPGLLLAVDKRPGTSALDVTRQVNNVLKELRPGLSGVRVDANVFRPAAYIDDAIDTLTIALLVGFGLVVLAIAAFFLEWRAVLIGAITIPLSLLAAVLAIDALGYTINALVVAGLLMASGLVVADVMATVYEIARRVRDHRASGNAGPASAIVVEASTQVRSSIAYATLIVLASAGPLLIVKGLSASFVHPLALAYFLAAVASMLVTLTLTPALAALLFASAPPVAREVPLARRLGQGYEALLTRATQVPRRPLLAVVGVVGLVGLVALAIVSQPERPTFRDRNVLVRWDGAPSTSLPEMDRVTRRVASQLQSLPGVRDVAADIGRAVTSDRVVGTNSAELWVRMDDGADYDSTLSRIRDVADGAPGFRSQVTTYEADRSAGVLEKRPGEVVVRVYGNDFGVLQSRANQLARMLGRVPGLRDPRVEGLPTEQPTLRVQVDLAKALRHEIKPGDVRRAVATLTSGITVGNFFEQQKVFDVVVTGVASTRDSADSVRNLLIDTPNGGSVRLRDIAAVQIAPEPVRIQHDAVSRYVDVRARTGDRGLNDIRHDVQRRVESIPFPQEYHAELQGSAEPGHTSHGRFVTLIVAALIVILLLLQSAFSSWSLALLFMFTVPLSISGGLLVGLATGDAASLGAMAGLLAVAGLAVAPGVLLVTRFRHAEQEDGATPGADLVLRAARERSAPTAMSAVATALAMIPFVVLGDAAGNEITQPMAAVILGGLVTATLVNLFVVPALCLALGSTGTDARSGDEAR